MLSFFSEHVDFCFIARITTFRSNPLIKHTTLHYCIEGFMVPQNGLHVGFDRFCDAFRGANLEHKRHHDKFFEVLMMPRHLIHILLVLPQFLSYASPHRH